MIAVVPLRREASLLWTPDDGDVIPVPSADVLRALIENWTFYGRRATCFAQSGSTREARVVSLGDDGWTLHVRDHTMQRWGWPAAKLVTRDTEDGTSPTLTTSGTWYRPSEESDLAGGMLFAENIIASPVVVARNAWAWMSHQPLPDGYRLGRASFDPIPCTTIREAFERIPAEAFEWTSCISA